MQFVVLGYDADDVEALERRMAARPDHIVVSDELARNGHVISRAAILDEEERMVGSVMIVDFPSRADLDEWLEREPYCTNEVWQRIEIHPCQVLPLPE